MKRRDWIKINGLGLTSFFLPANKALSFIANHQLNTPRFSSRDFGTDFLWGAACASYQVEGAWNIDGKGPSVWDTFTHKKGKVHNNEHGDEASDFYHRYKEDITLLKKMNFGVFRFSISWPRLFAYGTGEVNKK